MVEENPPAKQDLASANEKDVSSIETPDPNLQKRFDASLTAALAEAKLEVPPETRGRLLRRVFREFRAEFFQGPMPPPKVMKDYDVVVPGLARQIAEMAKAEQKHRHSWENWALANNIFCQSGALITGNLLLVICIGLYAYLVTHNVSAIVAAPLLAPPIFSVIKMMIGNSSKTPKISDETEALPSDKQN